MKIIDLHQDLLSHIRFRDKFDQSHQTDFTVLEQSDIDIVVATAFPLPANDDQFDPSVHQLITEELFMYKDYCDRNQSWELLLSPTDFSKNSRKLLLHVEGLNIFAGTEEHWSILSHWHDIGLRSLATHWNLNNKLGGGTLDTQMHLSELGEEVIAWAEKKKILLDFAHMGRKTFSDAVKCVNRPIYISHGNADAVCSNIRNYTDEQLKIVASTGGVIGVFFPNTFVVGKGNNGTLSDVISHISYMKKLIGIDHIAIGSDFGGIISGTVQGLSSVSDLPFLIKELRNKSFSDEEIRKILYGNAHRVIIEHLS